MERNRLCDAFLRCLRSRFARLVARLSILRLTYECRLKEVWKCSHFLISDISLNLDMKKLRARFNS
jgi:hypothetical protein